MLLQLLSIQFCYAEVMEIRVWNHTEDKPGIIGRIMHRALQVTNDEFGDYTIVRSSEMGQTRALRALAHDQLDIAHFVSTKEREAQADVIHIPIMQGLLGYRLCLITTNNQQKFSHIGSKNEWIANNIITGQHYNWPDSTILQSNKLAVVTTYKTELLFQQLAKNRFDCFSRGLSEISNEQLDHQDLGIVIEKNIVIYYPLPQFFFVNPAKPVLTKRLRKGLLSLQENNELDNIFNDYYDEIINRLNLKNRVFISLHNPTLSQQAISALDASSINFKNKYLSK